MAVALYLATYFDLNQSSKLYYETYHENSQKFQEFYKLWGEQDDIDRSIAD